MAKKIKTSYEDYLKLKEQTVERSYSERFEKVRFSLYWFSWIGNIFSIFLAYFFVKGLFETSFSEIGTNLFILGGIVVFLTLFEFLKRYIFGLFSLEYLKEKHTIFRKNMITFLLSVSLIIGASFYLSLNGAKKFVDNTKLFETAVETKISTNVDSINYYYNNNLITPLQNENIILNNRIDSLSKLNNKQSIINSALKNIDKNKDKINKYESERDLKISDIKNIESTKLVNSNEENNSNMIAFIILSTLIEIIIMIGVYYDVFFNYKKLKEYEDEVISTPGFKKWYKYNFILELLYEGDVNVGDKLVAVTEILELCNSSNLQITKSELDKMFKVLYHLKIVKLEGNRRIYNMNQIDAIKQLKKYFKIN